MRQIFKLHYLLFICFTLISVVPVVFLATWVQQTAYEKEVSSVEEKHLLLARNLTAALSRYTYDLRSVFIYTAHLGGDQRMLQGLPDMLRSLNLKHVCNTDLDGNINHISTYIPARIGLKRVSEKVMKRLRPYIEDATITPGKVVFTGVLPDNADKPSIYLIMSLRDGQLAIGEVSTKYIEEIARDISFGNKGHAAIVDHRGHVIAHPVAQWTLEMKDISKVKPVAKMMLGETGVTTFYSPALEAEMIAGYATVPDVGWGVMVPQPLAELKQRTAQVRHIMMLILIVGFIISGLISWFLAKYIAAPIQSVVAITKDISKGNYTECIPESGQSGPRELRVMTAAINTMISDINRYKKRLLKQANHDDLTNLPNRTLLLDRLEQAINSASRDNKKVGLLFIDLDRFKEVNDTYGHAIGDRLLQQVAARLKDSTRKSDTVARIGGDEFAVLLPYHEKDRMAEKVSKKIIKAINKSFILDSKEVFIGASIGITVFPNDSDNPASMLQHGDIAMYQAKTIGRNTYRFFTEEMNRDILKRVEIERELHNAIARDEISLHYQPIVDIETGKVTHVEALMRWTHPELGEISPAVFIPIAEETGSIRKLGKWLLNTACDQLKAWRLLGLTDINMSLNLSSREIPLGFSVQEVKSVLDRTGVSANSITFEITEGFVLDDTDEILLLLNGLRTLGVKLPIDDFGTGYSSFCYLTRFPIDVLKIDRSFIQNMLIEPENSRLVEGIIALGKQLNLKVVAEGIETQEQLAFLKKCRCDYAQGYYLLPPVQAKEAFSFINKEPSNKAKIININK